jgi:glycosyltransferase involved in cell wall biosynthesis
MAAAPSLRRELAARGFENVRPWSRGVDVDLFRPRRKREIHGSARPIFLNVGRVSIEKNLGAFLDLDLPGTKWVVGDGPLLPKLRARHPQVRFFGAQQGEALAALYAEADAFVFPSRTDTFGLVMLEALACGVPVAAYPAPGPLDAAGDPKVAVLSENLRAAAMAALALEPRECRAYAERLSWRRTADQFFTHLAIIPSTAWPSTVPAMEADSVPRTAT